MFKNKFLKIITVASILCVLCFSFSGCLFNSGDRFDDYLDDLFIALFSGDGFSVNFLFDDPAAYGLENETASISTPSSKSDYESGMKALSSQATIMKLRYRYNQLSDEQKVIYDYLTYFFNLRSQYADYYYLQDDFIGSYLGFQANLPVYLTEYKFNSKHDIDNYFNLIAETATAFPAYVAYEQDRIANGYGRADFVYDGAIEQCENFVGLSIDGSFVLPSEPNFLLQIFDERINACSFLTAEEAVAYKTQNITAVNETLLPAYFNLGKAIVGMKGNANSNQQGLSYYSGGKSYYELLVKDATGSDDSIDTIKQNLTNAYINAINLQQNLLNQIYVKEGKTGLSAEEKQTWFNGVYEAWQQADTDNNWTSEALNGAINSLKTSISADFPSVTTHGNIILKSVPETLKDNYSPAAYFTSHVDSLTSDHVILINSYDTSGYISFDLMSHEGLPGHLYQDAYFKNIGVNKVMSAIGQSSYKEGWSTYVEGYCAKYYQPDTLNNLLYQLYLLENRINQFRVALMDIWVNYDGLTKNQLIMQVNGTLGFNYAAGTEGYASIESYCGRVFEHVVEVPTNVLKYYYTMLKIEQLQTAYKQKLGDQYTDLAFHTAVMKYGALPISMYFDILA